MSMRGLYFVTPASDSAAFVVWRLTREPGGAARSDTPDAPSGALLFVPDTFHPFGQFGHHAMTDFRRVDRPAGDLFERATASGAKPGCGIHHADLAAGRFDDGHYMLKTQILLPAGSRK